MDVDTQLEPKVAEADPAGFAFARIRGVVHLVYAPNLPANISSSFALPSSPLKLSTTTTQQQDTPIPVFRHDFVSVFRFSHIARAADVRLLERLPANAARHDPGSDEVFLAHDAAVRMRALDAANSPMMTAMARVPGCQQQSTFSAVPRRSAQTRRVC